MKYYSVIVMIVLGVMVCDVAISQGHFVSVMEDKTPLYAVSGQSDALAILYVSRYYPLEVVSDNKDWLLVKEMKGKTLWVEAKHISDLRTVVALQVTDVHETADAASPVIFRIDKSVVLWLVDDASMNGFLHVRHIDGLVGYVFAQNMWGFSE